MAVTWEQARQMVHGALCPVDDDATEVRDFDWPPRWDPAHGTFHVAFSGTADDQFWCVAYGAREYLVDGDVRRMVVGDPLALVDREAGRLTFVAYLTSPDRFRGMEPI